jgi:hypothetical protein
MHARSVVKALLYGIEDRGLIEPELIPVDRILQRWAAANGTGLPSDEWDQTPRARSVPLDDVTATIVDQIILKLPPRTKRLITTWYRRPLPTSVLAEQLRTSPRSLEVQWRLALNFLRWKFEATNHLTLLRLLRIRPD